MFRLNKMLLAVLLLSISNAINAEADKNGKSSNFSILWHFGGDEELSNLTHKVDKLNLDIKELNERQTALEKAISAMFRNQMVEMKTLLDDQEKKLTESLKSTEKATTTLTLPKTCADALSYKQPAGVYQLYLPNAQLELFSAYCLHDPQNKGTAWTIIQRRLDGTISFERNWQLYKNGFGLQTGEYFIGLEKLFKLTHWQRMELWIKLVDHDNVERSARYNQFEIAGEHEKYALKALGTYDGNAGDSFHTHLGANFSTIDNDSSKKKCANYFRAGWWYENCQQCASTDKYPSWHYSSSQQQCLLYENISCEGKKNNFTSKKTCEENCLKNKAVCQQRPEVGNCSNYATMWHYKPSENRCYQFYYGGCGGNENKFPNEDSCMAHCAASNAEIINDCDQSYVRGGCKNFHQQWYYDKASYSCHSFPYSGCDGNNNRFDTKEECMQQCGSQIIQRVLPKFSNSNECGAPVNLISCTKSSYKWYYEPRVLRCLEVGNRQCGHFESEGECVRACGALRQISPNFLLEVNKLKEQKKP